MNKICNKRWENQFTVTSRIFNSSKNHWAWWKFVDYKFVFILDLCNFGLCMSTVRFRWKENEFKGVKFIIHIISCHTLHWLLSHRLNMHKKVGDETVCFSTLIGIRWRIKICRWVSVLSFFKVTMVSISAFGIRKPWKVIAKLLLLS